MSEIPYGSPDEVDGFGLTLALLVLPGVRSWMDQSVRSHRLGLEDHRAVSQLLPRVHKPAELSREEAYNVLRAAFLLRAALEPRKPGRAYAQGTGEAVPAEQPEDAHGNAEEGTFSAD